MCFTTAVAPETRPDPVLTVLPLWEDIGIVDLSAQGDGVGRHEGQVVFVPYVIPGEIVDVQVSSLKPSFARADLTRLRLPSPTRTQAACRHFTQCGGCQYQHIAYPAQPEIAAASVLGNLRKLLRGWELPEPELLISPSGYGNRTQARLQFLRTSGEARMPGYVGVGGAVVPVTECPVLHPVLQALLAALLPWLASDAMQAQLTALDMRFLTLQCNRDGTEAALLFHTFELLNLKKHWDEDSWGEGFEQLREQVPACVGLVLDNGQTDVGFGQNYTSEPGSLAPYVPLGAFKQNHAELEPAMRDLLLDWLHPRTGERGYDLYCGRGELTARLAEAGSRVTGIESAPVWFEKRTHVNWPLIPEALKSRLSFVQHTVEQWLPGQPEVDWVLANPPRKGLEPPVMDWLHDHGPARWAYLSCNPATFARDCQPLRELYRLTHLTFLDFFPQTAKMELVALLERR